MNQQIFSEIIERVEHVRKLLNMNKSKFCRSFGMSPQTYNNFIGSQGSKPNIELIFGIIDKFKVNPDWLLNGSGGIFLPLTKDQGEFESNLIGSSAEAKLQFSNSLREFVYRDPASALRVIKEVFDALNEQLSKERGKN